MTAEMKAFRARMAKAEQLDGSLDYSELYRRGQGYAGGNTENQARVWAPYKKDDEGEE